MPVEWHETSVFPSISANDHLFLLFFHSMIIVEHEWWSSSDMCSSSSKEKKKSGRVSLGISLSNDFFSFLLFFSRTLPWRFLRLSSGCHLVSNEQQLVDGKNVLALPPPSSSASAATAQRHDERKENAEKEKKREREREGFDRIFSSIVLPSMCVCVFFRTRTERGRSIERQKKFQPILH